MNESTDSSTGSGARGRAGNLKQRLKEDSKQKVETGKRAAADQIAEIADAIDLAGSQLDQSQPTLANYASKLADGIGGLATRLREDSIEDIYREVRQLATRHPGMFLLGSAALGMAIARFMKASAEPDTGDFERAGTNLGASGSDTEDWAEQPPIEDVEITSTTFYSDSPGSSAPGGSSTRGV